MLVWIAGAAVLTIVKALRELKVEQSQTTQEAPLPKEESSSTFSSSLEIYTKERELLEQTASSEVSSAVAIELDIFEAFIVHTSEEGGLAVLNSLVLLLTAANCAKSLNNKFPKDCVPYILKEGEALLCDEIERWGYTYEFKKVARRSAVELAILFTEYLEIPSKAAAG